MFGIPKFLLLVPIIGLVIGLIINHYALKRRAAKEKSEPTR